jgi:hypothetical protein
MIFICHFISANQDCHLTWGPKLFWFFCFVVLFCVVNQCLCLLSEWTQLSEHCTFSCHLIHVSPTFGHHQVDFTTYMEKNTERKASTSIFLSMYVAGKSTWC